MFAIDGECGRPEVKDPYSVMLMGTSYRYGDRLMFMCRFGFSPIRIPPVLTCLRTGEWDGEPICSGKFCKPQ